MNKRANGEGTLTRRSDGSWAGAISTGYDGSGKRKRRWVYGKSQAEVREKLRKLIQQQAEGTLSDPSRTTLATFLEKWLEAKERSVRPRTLEIYGHISKCYIIPRIGRHKLTKVNAPLIDEALADIARAVSLDAAARSRQTLFAAMRQAVRWGYLYANPVERTERPRLKKREAAPLNPQQAALILTHARTHRLYAAFYLLLSTGLRRGELLGLQWGDLRGSGILVCRSLTESGFTEPKTEKGSRFIPLSSDALEVLEAHRQRQAIECKPRHDLMFTTSVGTPIIPANFWRDWTHLQDRANGIDLALSEALRCAKTKEERAEAVSEVKKRFTALRVRLHDLRHTFATWEIAGGADPRTVADTLGHARASFTLDVYAHAFSQARKKPALSLSSILPDFQRSGMN